MLTAKVSLVLSISSGRLHLVIETRAEVFINPVFWSVDVNIIAFISPKVPNSSIIFKGKESQNVEAKFCLEKIELSFLNLAS